MQNQRTPKKNSQPQLICEGVPGRYNISVWFMEGVMRMKRKITLKDMVMVGMMAAFVFAACYIQFKIPTPLGETRLHLGNVLCLLSGFLLGPWRGGMAAGLGSMFFDLFDPMYITSAPTTFINKFAMAAVCALVLTLLTRLQKKGLHRDVLYAVVAAAAGQATYIVLYLLKNFVEQKIFFGVEMQTVLIDLSAKLATSSLNAVVSIIASVLLYPLLKKALAPILLRER